MRLFLAILLLALPRIAAADCVELHGDATATAAIGDLLSARGIASEASCAIVATIDRTGAQLAVHVELADGSIVDRVVDEPRTAATVIESFVRADIGSTLLAARAVPPPPPPSLPPVIGDEPRVVATTSSARTRGVHVFAAFESTFANDRTGWIGAHAGACIMLGPVCAAARLRYAQVVSGPDIWQQTVRRSNELLLGIDIPFAMGRVLLSPGFAAGVGVMRTHGETRAMRAETGGLRADVHATLSVPIWGKLALDVFAAGDLTQEAHVEWGPEMVPLPPEPRFLLRFGAGLRYEGL